MSVCDGVRSVEVEEVLLGKCGSRGKCDGCCDNRPASVVCGWRREVLDLCLAIC